MLVKPVSTRDLFVAVRAAGYSTSLAHVAAELLYWSQHGQIKSGKPFFYKEDADLAKELGVHPKTAGRAVRALCSAGDDDSLFHLTYHPKPGQQWGRVRWLTLAPAGERLLAAGRETEIARQKKSREKKAFRREHKAAMDDSPSLQSAGADRGLRSPRNAPTKIQTDFNGPSDAHSNALSLARRESKPRLGKEELPEGVKRFVGLWETACKRVDRPDLISSKTDVIRYRREIEQAIREARIDSLADDECLERLKMICGQPSRFRDMTESFDRFNKGGVRFKSFLMYAPQLMASAAEYLKEDLEAQSDRPFVHNIVDLMKKWDSEGPEDQY